MDSFAKKMIDGFNAEAKEPETTTTGSVVEPVVHEPIVEDEVPTEVPSGAVETEQKDWFDILPKGEANNVEKEVLSNNEELQAEIQRLREYESILKTNPEVRAIFDGVKSNKRVEDILKQIKGPDVDSMSTYEVKKLELQSLGLSEEEINDELEEFKELSPAKQKIETAKFKQLMKSEGEQRVQKLNAPREELETIRQGNKAKAKEDLSTISREMVGKELYGLTITSEIASKVTNAINNVSVWGDEDNGYDIGKSFDHHLKNIYFSEIVKANVTKERNKTKEAVLDSITRPDKNNGSRPATSVKADDDAANSAKIKAIFGFK